MLENRDKTFICKTTKNHYRELNKFNVDLLYKLVVSYHSTLSELGITVAPIFLEVDKYIYNSYILYLKQPYYKTTLDKKMQSCGLKTYRKLIKAILSTINIIFLNDFIISIDPKPSNFAYSGNKIIYFDLIPPLIHKKEGYNFFKRDDEGDQNIDWKLRRYFTLNGLLQVLLIRFALNNMKYFPILTEEIIQFIQSLSIDYKKQDELRLFVELLEDKTDLDYLKIIKKCKIENRDILRIIFIKNIIKKGEDFNDGKIENFFNLSKKPKTFQASKEYLLYFLTEP